MNWIGHKVQPKYSVPYHIIKVESYGSSAVCQSLCPTIIGKRIVKEIHINDGCKIDLPLTDGW